MTNVARKSDMSGAFGSRAGRPVRGRSEDAPDGVRDAATARPGGRGDTANFIIFKDPTGRPKTGPVRPRGSRRGTTCRADMLLILS